MERADRAARDAVLRKIFPGLGVGQDPEVGLYFRLRAEGRTAEALALFNRVLKSRYPDDGKRSELFNLFRRSDPRFSAFHDELLWDLFRSASARIRETLDSLCEPVSRISTRDASGFLSALESVVRLLPAGRDAALARLGELCVLAGLLKYKAREIQRVRTLAARYFDGECSDSPDLSRVRLSAREIEGIEIPSNIVRREDRAVAFCFKYWDSSKDPAFERRVLLYSRKHGTPHHRILRIIREGRATGTADEEILSRVCAALSPGYSYTTQGDLYMQRAWKALKERREPSLSGTKLVKADPSRAGRPSGRRIGTPAVSGKAAPERRSSRPGGAREAGRDSDRGTGVPEPRPRKPRGSVSKSPRRRSASGGGPGGPAQPSPPAPRGSVSDRIKALSGRRYDVYREEFLARVGPAIRDWLSGRRIKPKDVFEDPLGRAEDLIRDFLERNYSNPYMDWEKSDTRSRVEDLGFSVPDLDGIISLWYERRRA
ncbi:MAG: hypothetical protein GX430_02205 [Treponema sp.]|nr:hypothetical protein [Treponema sp.]